MKLKKISILFILLPLCIFFTACSKENDNAPKQSENIIDFEQGNMNFTEGAGEQTFSFTTNTAWVVSVASTRNRGVPWCTVAPTSGNAGSHTIKVTTTPNETYDDRSVTVTLKAGAEVKSFVVSQKQKDALLLTNDKFEVDQAGGTVTVEVKSNVSYTATIGEECKDWIKESNSTRALSTTTKSYTVAMNEDGKKREGSIIFSDGSLTETVHIYQAGGSIILLSQNDCHVSASGEEITVELRSNCDYEVVMPSVDWIKETMTRGMSSHTLHYTVAPNDSYDGRKTEIIYRDKSDSSIADTLTILQAQKDAIIISEKEVKVGSEGGTVEVKIDANVDFEMQLPDVEWISETSTRGLSTHKKYLKIAENTGETSRTAEVVFKNTTSGIEETLTVSQSAKGKRVKVHVEKAGTLSDYIAESEKLNVEELEVSGNLGGKDIAFIREMAGTYNHANTEGKLVYLDMTEANIVADGEYYLPNSSGKEYLPTENTIGERMFTSRGLQTILLPKSVTSIDDRAFSSCHSLNKVVIYENSVKTIGMAAFEYCSSLADIVLPEGVTTIARSAFWGCSSLSRIDLPEGVTTIGHSAFLCCSHLTMTIPETVTSIGSQAFRNNADLSIAMSGNLLDNALFSDCENLRITLSNGSTFIKESALINCSGLIEIHIPNSVSSIGAHAFYGCTNLKNIIIPNKVTSIEERTFYECKGLVSVVIPNSVKSIEYEAFNGCSALKSIVLPEGMTLIKKWTFADCSSLVDVTLPSTMTTLEYGAFENCTSLRSVTIPNSVNTVDAPFYGCSSLSDIKVPDYLYETSIFSGTGITDITVPEGTTVVGSFADCTKLASITFPEGIKALTDFSGCSSLRAIDIPDGVSVIGSALFRGCVNLTKVTIPNSVVSLEWFAFSDCSSLTRITIPNHIATISSGAFSGCSLLTNVTLGSGVASIEDIAFHNAPIRQLRCYAVVPPKLHGVVDGSFSADLVKGATLYVPAGTGMAYSESDWKIYFENIVEMEE